MSNSEPDRPGQARLHEMIEDTIGLATEEWDLTTYDAVGVLTVVIGNLVKQALDDGD